MERDPEAGAPSGDSPLSGGGEMGALMRSIDWSKTPVGPVAGSPQSLRTALSILLETGFPMYIAWGSGFTQFYNDGYRPILGSTKHPAAMGISTRETFKEKLQLTRRPVDIAEIAAKAVEMASPLFETRSHQLDIQVPRNQLFVDGDAVRLSQVLGNLMTNAARYTPARGNVRLSAAQEGDEVVVRVQDDGMGIAAEFLPRIFDLFVRSPRAIDRREGGLGLGLAVVKNLVTLHGGTVTARSPGPGRGSEFTVRLPALPIAKRPLESPGEEPPRPALRGRRVLVVDDNVDAAEILAETLENLGHEVAVAHDGPEALSVQARFQADIGVLDLGLPVMDGYELATRMRRMGERPLRLIALTGYGQDSDRERSSKAGFDAHLVKPVEVDELNALISALPSDSVN